MNNEELPNTEHTAVSLYDQEGSLDDFPVLKAFQQYIDAEQDKARRRMLSLCIFFGCLMTVIVTVFVVLLMNISNRNQELNNRMIEIALKRDAGGSPASSPVVVQPPQDSAAILALTTKIEALQKKLVEDQAKAEKAAAEAVAKAQQAAIEAAKPKAPSAEQLEIKKLQELLAAEKERSALEKERQRQAELLEKKRQREAELEAYRRKYYPELYEAPVRRKTARRVIREEEDDMDDEDGMDDVQELINLVDEGYANAPADDDEEDVGRVPKQKRRQAKSAQAKSPAGNSEKEYSIPVDVKGSSIRWNIPND